MKSGPDATDPGGRVTGQFSLTLSTRHRRLTLEATAFRQASSSPIPIDSTASHDELPTGLSLRGILLRHRVERCGRETRRRRVGLILLALAIHDRHDAEGMLKILA